MKTLSHSFHLSTGKHSISNATQLRGVDAHNNRKFKNEYNENLDLNKSMYNYQLIGTNNITNDVYNIYDKEFKQVVDNYNQKQKRDDRKINNYFEEVAKHKQKSVAEEIIIQFGDRNDFGIIFNKDDVTHEDRMELVDAYKDYLQEFQKAIPNFKIANATVHFDEKTPHMHVVGVPIAKGFKKGLEKQVSKSKVFNRDNLSVLQDYMGQTMQKVLKKHLNLDVEIDKKQGRNRNYSTWEIKEYYKKVELSEELLQEKITKGNKLNKENDSIQVQIEESSKVLDQLDQITLEELKKKEKELLKRQEERRLQREKQEKQERQQDRGMSL